MRVRHGATEHQRVEIADHLQYAFLKFDLVGGAAGSGGAGGSANGSSSGAAGEPSGGAGTGGTSGGSPGMPITKLALAVQRPSLTLAERHPSPSRRHRRMATPATTAAAPSHLGERA